MAVLPEGRYVGKITGHDITSLGRNELPAVTVDFVVGVGVTKSESGKYDGGEHDAKGAQRGTAFFIEGDEGIERLLKTINQLGWDPESLELFGSEHYDESPLKDKEIQVTIYHKDGKERYYINPPYQAKDPAKVAAEKKNVLDRFGGAFKAYQAMKKVQKAAQEMDPETIPF